MEKLLPLIVGLVVVLGIIGGRESHRGVRLFWGLQFLGAGVNPVPPPQVQLEEVNGQGRIKKDPESGGS
jgi:hypothetical protein